MTYFLDAAYVTSEKDEFITLIVFADDEAAPCKYVMLQKPHHYDEQDKKLGMDKIHLQVEDEARAMYGAISKVEIGNENVILELTSEAQNELDIDGSVDINVRGSPERARDALCDLKVIAEEDGIPISEA